MKTISHRISKNMKGLSGMFVLLLIVLGPTEAIKSSIGSRCIEITIPMCRGIGYNYTYMPNQFYHDTQEEAGLEAHQFWPLVETRCAPELRFFLCSMYTPICIHNYEHPLPACKSVCERAKSGCAPIMKQFGFAWPERMSCDNLPDYGTDRDRLCMQYNSTLSEAQQSTAPAQRKGSNQRDVNLLSAEEIQSSAGTTHKQEDCFCECRFPFILIRNTSSDTLHKSEYDALSDDNCVLRCEGMYKSEEKRFARLWLGLWSTFCLISASITLLTFFLDPQRFDYPERPIIYIVICYAFVSLGYIVRLAQEATIECRGLSENTSIIRSNSVNGSLVCNIVFFLIYFFGMAANIWWIILSLTWLLSAGLKWGREAICRLSHYFHLMAWLLPSAKTIAIFSMAVVDGDPLSGTCYVGNSSNKTLFIFVLIPLCVYLTIGSLFIIVGFVSLMRIRRAIRKDGLTRTDKLDKFIVRIGVFSLLHALPIASVLACYAYEYRQRNVWKGRVLCPCSSGSGSVEKPEFSVIMFKYFMCLVVGITSGFWIWSGKTVNTWRMCSSRCFSCLCNRRDDNRSENNKMSNNDLDKLQQQCLTTVDRSDSRLNRYSDELSREKLTFTRI